MVLGPSGRALGPVAPALAPAATVAVGVSRSLRVAVSILLSVASASASVAVGALGTTARADTPAAPAPATLDPAVKKRLESGDEREVKQGLMDLRFAGKAAVPMAPAIADLLRRGATAALTEQALDTWVAIAVGAPVDADVAVPYAAHRNVAVRRAAVRALGHAKGGRAVTALRRALADAEPTVRSAAATALGALKADGAVGDLAVALDHGVVEAASAMGQACGPADCEQLLARLGRLPFDVITAGLEEILFRPDAEVPEKTKLAIVARLRDLRTSEAGHFLAVVSQKWPKGGSAHVKTAVDEAVMAIGGVP